MKKRLLFVAAIFAATATFAQDGLTSKKGEAYLPEAGDWAIGIDANPVLDYAGNLFSGSTAKNTFGGANWFTGVPGGTIYGKMFKDEKTAYRAMLRIGFGSTSQSTIFDHTLPGATAPTSFTDEFSTSANNIVLGGGIEKRRGNTRIQGVYGAQLMIGFGGSSSKTEYGVAITQDTTMHTNANPRTTETKNGSTFLLGINGFIGVEWFFAPKVSLGAEYTWGLGMISNGEGETTQEWWGTAAGAAPGTANSLQTKTTKTGGSSSFSLDNGLSGTSISLNFHF